MKKPTEEKSRIYARDLTQSYSKLPDVLDHKPRLFTKFVGLQFIVPSCLFVNFPRERQPNRPTINECSGGKRW